MGDLYRLRIPWSGSGVVGGGLTTLYFGAAATTANITPAVNTFLNAIKSYVTSSVTWTIPNGGDTLDSGTGARTGGWTSGGAYSIAATGTGAFASGVGGRVAWQTNSIHNGRRVHGSTYLVPLTTLRYDNDGSLEPTMVAAVNTAAAAFIATTGIDFCIWARPHPKGATNGAEEPVVSGTMPDKVSWLRTRRT